MAIKKLDEVPQIFSDSIVKYMRMGCVSEIQYMSRRNNFQTIQMLPGGNQYVVLSTGEVKDVSPKLVRSNQKKNLYKTFSKIRAYINTNVVDVKNVRWCTLTYAENMTITTRLYEDFRKFNQRFQYYCSSKGYAKPEYIAVCEPQGRGAWHIHLLYIWGSVAPFVPHNEFSALWGYGFVRVGSLDSVDNVGAYLTAYLGDIEIKGFEGESPFVKDVVIVDDSGKELKKRILKGGRLCMYPSNFNIFRCSRGIRKPTPEFIQMGEALKKVEGKPKTFESAYCVSDEDTQYKTVIVKQYYKMN